MNKFITERTIAHMNSGVMQEIIQEMVSQDKKWGQNRNLELLLWNAILVEEVGEVSKAILESDQGLRQELIQVAAVCAQWIQCIDRTNGDEK